jgi:hypothetical protein
MVASLAHSVFLGCTVIPSASRDLAVAMMLTGGLVLALCASRSAPSGTSLSMRAVTEMADHMPTSPGVSRER